MKTLLALLFTILSLPVSAGTVTQQIDDITRLKEEPAGVVFEIITGKDDGLDWALPQTKMHIDRLRHRFPNLQIAIVTHGREMFALQKSGQDAKPKVHDLTRELVREGVNLHVCGVHAGWKGLTEEDFPDYVNVAAAGPAQINDYLAVGYIKVVIKKPGQK